MSNVSEYKEIEIWIIEFREVLKHFSRMEALLSATEKSYKNAFHFEKDAERYVCAHGTLRSILGFYTRQSPHLIHFSSGFRGKPRMTDPVGIEFNLSHTKGLIAVAVTANRDVGVDIERRAKFSNMDDVARKIMPHEEYLWYMACTSNDRVDFFYRCWVRKEAVVKAWGSGLYQDMEGFSVMTEKAQEMHNSSIVLKGIGNQHTCCVADLEIKGDHVGAVCIEGDRVEISMVDDRTIESVLNYS